MMMVKQLILASQSPFRRSLLAAAGLRFEAETAPVDERDVAGLPPRALALGRARLKGAAVARLRPDALVIGADQVLGLEGVAYDKAESEAEAAVKLRELAGKTHTLHSAVTLILGGSGREVAHFVVDVPMPMRGLSDDEISAYVATGEWRGVVGCYQFENRGVHLFEAASFDHSAIVGLPLQPLLKALRALGVDALSRPAPPWELSV